MEPQKDNVLLLENKSTPEKSETEVFYLDRFETYCLWKSIPAIFKYPPKDKKTGISPSPREFSEMLGVDDLAILDLVDMRTQKDFAERFNLHMDTLTDWNKRVKARNSMEDIRSWARGLTKNVFASLYNTAVRKGGAMEVKLWAQLVEGWEEKQKVEHDYKGVESFTIIRNIPNENKLGTDGEAVPSLGDITKPNNV